MVFHSLTNPIEEVGLRLLSSVSGVDSYRMRTGELDDIEWTDSSAGLAKAEQCTTGNRSRRIAVTLNPALSIRANMQNTLTPGDRA